MATWPGSLPQSPNVDGFSDIPQSTVIRSAMGGLTKQRTRFTAAVHSVSESYVITSAQADTFVAFFRDDLDNGGLEFDKPDFLYGGTSVYQFAEPYDLKPLGGDMWRLSISLEKQP